MLTVMYEGVTTPSPSSNLMFWAQQMLLWTVGLLWTCLLVVCDV